MEDLEFSRALLQRSRDAACPRPVGVARAFRGRGQTSGRFVEAYAGKEGLSQFSGDWTTGENLVDNFAAPMVEIFWERNLGIFFRIE